MRLVSRPHTDKKRRNPTAPKIIDFPKRVFFSSSCLSFFIYVVFQTQKQLFTNTTPKHTLHTIFAFSYLTWKGSQQQQSERFSYYYNFPSFFFSRLCLTRMVFLKLKKRFLMKLFNATQTLVGLLHPQQQKNSLPWLCVRVRLTQVRVDLFHELKWKIFANLFKSRCDGEDVSRRREEKVSNSSHVSFRLIHSRSKYLSIYTDFKQNCCYLSIQPSASILCAFCFNQTTQFRRLELLLHRPARYLAHIQHMC